MLTVAFDTDVLVAARRSRTGASNVLLQYLRSGRIRAVANVAMMLEYEAVLKRADHLSKMRMTERGVDAVLDAFALLAQPVTPHFLWRPSLRDPADEMVLDAAVCGGAGVIVTFNRKDYLPGVGRFRIEALTPGETLERI